MHYRNLGLAALLYFSLTGCTRVVVQLPAPPAPEISERAPAPIPEPLPAPQFRVNPDDIPTRPVIIPPPAPVEPPVTPPVTILVVAPVVELPEAPLLTAAGRALIYEFEVGGGQRYYDRFLSRPTWPGAASGVTVAIGYDLGYNSKAVILSDWKALPAAPRLAGVSGTKGQAAKARVTEVRDILIAWGAAEEVYNAVTVTKFWQLCQRTWPGFDALRPNAQAALLSLTFNRGDSLIGERRKEMKEIARLAPKKDYRGMGDQFRAMKRVWKGTDIQAGMFRRRDAEAALMDSAA